MSLTKQQLLKSKLGLFGERENLDEAFKYAQSMIDSKDHGAMATAIMVYHNTLIQMLANDMEDDPNETLQVLRNLVGVLNQDKDGDWFICSEAHEEVNAAFKLINPSSEELSVKEDIPEIPWQDAPEGTTHCALGSICHWERINPDGSGDYYSFINCKWVRFTNNYETRLQVAKRDGFIAVVESAKDKSVPLGGWDVKDPSKCRIERKGECGCAFGQCENGLIY